ncbi:serine/arginine repetitive matrix protein 1-like [Hordeum vulgare]|uniref:Uncharacterized protein n=1 Tax=Hordeum vulgare subsp. vulgare TaxID=112509 RepID=A0A8I6YDI1_HORVV|nr:uncharacterized protein LOC123396827 [Hordeum vulgare subsp. vulgare]KAE8784622.1 serine/arginine repetitive matrix protein 1-like [Hordeum vulgare]KAI4990512.1 hypothetical protein ZWY2020_038875 [Hordeum vulgare]
MASHDALWAKLWELELQLAAYKLLHAARRGEDDDVAPDGAREAAGTGACRRGRQYDAYMRRRDARRVSVAAAAKSQQQQQRPIGGTRAGGRPGPLTVKCAARDTPQVRRTVPSGVSTPRKEHGALPLPRSRTVSSGAPVAMPQSHRRRNSVGGDLGDCATPRPFLRRGSGTGGAIGNLRSPRVHDLPSGSPSPRRAPLDQFVPKVTAGRHLRSVSELPLRATSVESPRWVETPRPDQSRARKRWGGLESPPPAIFSAPAANPHMDLAKGLRKLLSFVRKGKSGERQRDGGGRESGDGKPVKEWTACSVLDGPFERASLEGHRFPLPMTRAVGTSG